MLFGLQNQLQSPHRRRNVLTPQILRQRRRWFCKQLRRCHRRVHHPAIHKHRLAGDSFRIRRIVGHHQQRRARVPRQLSDESLEGADLHVAKVGHGVLEEADALGYPTGYEESLEDLLQRGRAELPGGLTWELRLGDFTRLVAEEPARADLIFFDPFSPASNPELWALTIREGLYRAHPERKSFKK